jgi:hypothetical protein
VKDALMKYDSSVARAESVIEAARRQFQKGHMDIQNAQKKLVADVKSLLQTHETQPATSSARDQRAKRRSSVSCRPHSFIMFLTFYCYLSFHLVINHFVIDFYLDQATAKGTGKRQKVVAAEGNDNAEDVSRQNTPPPPEQSQDREQTVSYSTSMCLM